jgi:hypothetical protein
MLAMTACTTTTVRPLRLPPHPAIGSPALDVSPITTDPAPRAQARAVVTHYFHVLNRLHLDMGYAALSQLLMPGCPCQVQVRAIRSAASKGERYLDRVRIIALRVNLDGPRAADVLADYRLVRGGLVDAAGHRLTRNPPHRVRWDFQLRRAAGGWRIARIDDLS